MLHCSHLNTRCLLLIPPAFGRLNCLIISKLKPKSGGGGIQSEETKQEEDSGAKGIVFPRNRSGFGRGRDKSIVACRWCRVICVRNPQSLCRTKSCTFDCQKRACACLLPRPPAASLSSDRFLIHKITRCDSAESIRRRDILQLGGVVHQ